MQMTIEVPDELLVEADEIHCDRTKHASLKLKKLYMLNPDNVTYWYFRLNGFLTSANFILHPEDGGGQRTDADLMGVRFPNHQELDLQDDEPFRNLQKPMIAICETTRGECKVNGPWSAKPHEREKRNIQYALAGIGAFSADKIEEAAESLYDTCRYDNKDADFIVQMFAIGKQANPTLTNQYPGLVQMSIEKLLTFIYRRFDARRSAKSNHQQWDETGQILWREYEKVDEVSFVKNVQKLMNVGPIDVA